MERVGAVVVGAGVIGLAVARALARSGLEVLVLESASSIGSGISSRNSEVIHAGIYYPKHSLKARLCVEGNRRLYEYCEQRGVAHRRCGKLIVATDSGQMEGLRSIQARANENGAPLLSWLDGNQARALEPALSCEAALLSPSTGILDSHAYMFSLQADLESAGGLVVFHCQVVRVVNEGGDWVLDLNDGSQLRTPNLINSAGLAAQSLASRIEGLKPEHVPAAYFAKGHYFGLAGQSPFQRLIYPMPVAAGLGVHFTIDLGGQGRFGPDVEWVQDPQDFTVDPSRAVAFYAEVRRYWPQLMDGALLPAYTGIRPKIQSPDESAKDFLIQGPAIHGCGGLVNLFGIESPGLTSSLALADEVLRRLADGS